MALFFKKQARIEAGFENFLGCLERSLAAFVTGMLSYLEHGLGSSFEKSVEMAHRAESEADDQRVELERTLFSKELLPDSRGDLLLLLEVADKIANRTEDVMFSIAIRQIETPPALAEDIKVLVEWVEQCGCAALTAIRMLFKDPRGVREIVEEVDRMESECDRKGHMIVRRIYSMEVDLAQKLLLDRLVGEISNIADAAEATASRLDIIAIRRAL